MAIFKKLDLWSVDEGLDEVLEYPYNYNREDQYACHYEDQINEMANLAGDLYNELQDLKSQIWYKMPYKKIEFSGEDDCTMTAIAWFNTAACMLSDIDMKALLENEYLYQSDEGAEKAKRIRALEKCTKEQQMWLYTNVIGFLTRYLELRAAFETIKAVIDELNYHQSFIASNGTVTPPQAAWV